MKKLILLLLLFNTTITFLFAQDEKEEEKVKGFKKENLFTGGSVTASFFSGGKVTGIIPKVLVEWERQHHGISELIVSDDMHARKKTIYSLCDAALILPGGFGTLDELFEILTWNQLSIHDKPIFILNSDDFYKHLILHIQHMQEEQFLYEQPEERMIVLNNPTDVIQYLL